MKRNVIFVSIAALALTAGIGLLGCSDNTIEHITSISDRNASDTQGPSYFPLEEGFEITYAVTQNGVTEYQEFWIGESRTIDEVTYYPWITKQQLRVDTAWFRETSTGLYYYTSLTATPERVLAYPVTTGAVWSRYDVDNIDGDQTGIDDYLGGDDQVSSEQDGDEPIVGDFPVTGSGNLTAESIGTLELDSGVRYSGALKIHNTGSGGYNCYWFVPGIGLARYAVGACETDGKTASVVGEMVDYVK